MHIQQRRRFSDRCGEGAVWRDSSERKTAGDAAWCRGPSQRPGESAKCNDLCAAPPQPNRIPCTAGFKAFSTRSSTSKFASGRFRVQPWPSDLRGNLVFQKGYGKLDYSAKAPAVTNETIYDLASLTKVITATTLAMQLYERGQLKLEHPVSRYFPGFVAEGRDKITIRHLLTHTSGSAGPSTALQGSQGKASFR